MNTLPTKKRTRLSPEARRSQLLDSAKVLIQKEGLSSFTMEALAHEADVSNPLVYKYFDTRLGLLQELLEREYERFSSNLLTQMMSIEEFDNVVRRNVELNFDEAVAGDIIYILRAQPDVQVVIQQSADKNLRKLGAFLIESAQNEYKLNQQQAQQLIAVASGASQAAARHYSRFGGSRSKFVDRTISFIMAGMDAFAE